MPKIKYNKEAQIMTIQISNKKSVDSDVQGNIVIDYDKEGKIVRIEMMNISLNEFKRNERSIRDFLIIGKSKASAVNFAIK